MSSDLSLVAFAEYQCITNNKLIKGLQKNGLDYCEAESCLSSMKGDDWFALNELNLLCNLYEAGNFLPNLGSKFKEIMQMRAD